MMPSHKSKIQKGIMIITSSASLLLLAASVAPAAAFVPQKVASDNFFLKQKPVFSETVVQVHATDADVVDLGEFKAKSFKRDEPPEINPLPEVFSGIGLPGGEVEPPRINNTFTNVQVDRYGAQALPLILGTLPGKPKTEGSLEVARNIAISLNKYAVDIPDPQAYKFFGNGEMGPILRMLLKTNPFFAPALTELPDGGFELKTFDPEGGPPTTLYQTILSTLNGVGHRVNLQFDKDMESITNWEMYDDVQGSDMKKCDVDLNTAASSAIYNCFFFSSCIHATIHVLHYLYTAAFQVASKDFPEMNQWANDYAKNIPWKYQQVGKLLLTADPQNQLAIITGGSGLGSSDFVRPILKKMLQSWGMKPTAEGFYMENMMNLPKDKVGGKNGVVLEEFMKHYELVSPFAKEASDALKKINPEKFATAEKKLGRYLSRCGEFTSSLSTIEQWIEMMAVTGAMHGGTLSYTRTMAMPEVLRWRNFVSPAWDFPDAFLLFSALGTIVGVDDDRHVMTDCDSGSPYADLLQDVLEKYNDKTTGMKREYQEKLVKENDFNDYGWIKSDYCLDDFDGKQLTIATYV
jgi:hypothetical protein